MVHVHASGEKFALPEETSKFPVVHRYEENGAM